MGIVLTAWMPKIQEQLAESRRMGILEQENPMPHLRTNNLQGENVPQNFTLSIEPPPASGVITRKLAKGISLLLVARVVYSRQGITGPITIPLTIPKGTYIESVTDAITNGTPRTIHLRMNRTCELTVIQLQKKIYRRLLKLYGLEQTKDHVQIQSGKFDAHGTWTVKNNVLTCNCPRCDY